MKNFFIKKYRGEFSIKVMRRVLRVARSIWYGCTATGLTGDSRSVWFAMLQSFRPLLMQSNGIAHHDWWMKSRNTTLKPSPRA